MNEAADITAVMRALADPTRRAVFERVVGSEEITVADLTRGSGVTQGAISQHLKSLKQAGLVIERPEGRNVYYRAQPDGLAPLVDWMRPRLMARPIATTPQWPEVVSATMLQVPSNLSARAGGAEERMAAADVRAMARRRVRVMGDLGGGVSRGIQNSIESI